MSTPPTTTQEIVPEDQQAPAIAPPSLTQQQAPAPAAPMAQPQPAPAPVDGKKSEDLASASTSVNIIEDILTASLMRNLSDKLYEKRKQGALEIEGMIKQLQQQPVAHPAQKTAIEKVIRKTIKSLEVQFINSPQPNARKGGLLGLAATTIALGQASLFLSPFRLFFFRLRHILMNAISVAGRAQVLGRSRTSRDHMFQRYSMYNEKKRELDTKADH